MNATAPATAALEAPGPQLKAEREKRGMSLQKAADELHLDPWVIEALETGDYPRIGPAVYAKGHLKHYAGLLGLSAAAIMAAYESRGTAVEAVTLAPPSARMAGAESQQPVRSLTAGLAAGAAAAVVIFAGVMWWRPWHHGSAPSATVAADSGAQQAAASVPPGAQEDEEPAVTAPKASAVMVRDVPAAAPPGDTARAALPGAGRARLRLSFSADSRVDVHDANGRSVFAGNGVANSVKIISGLAPMRVYLGSGSGVALEINDRAVAIGPQFFAGDAARFEAGADGVLRRDAQARNTRPRG